MLPVLRNIATGRSNNSTTIIAVQDYSRLNMMYSKEEAEPGGEVIKTIFENIELKPTVCGISFANWQGKK